MAGGWIGLWLKRKSIKPCGGGCRTVDILAQAMLEDPCNIFTSHGTTWTVAGIADRVGGAEVLADIAGQSPLDRLQEIAAVT